MSKADLSTVFAIVIAPMPSLAAVAATGKKSVYRKHGKLIGREARALGFNAILAPVLDLALPESHDQSCAPEPHFANPEQVIAYADAFLSGLESEDSPRLRQAFSRTWRRHPRLPPRNADHLSAAWTDLWQSDLLPYRELEDAAADGDGLARKLPGESATSKPASVSRHWITDILTKRIGYRGLILSDDMEMGGILTQTTIEEAAVQAVAAGTHLIEVCKDPSLLLRAYEALLAEAESSSAFREHRRSRLSKDHSNQTGNRRHSSQ